MRFPFGCHHPSFSPPWRSLLPYLVALHLLRPGSAQLRVVAPSLRVTANVGQDVVLRCHLCPCKDARSSDIRWIQHRTSGLVHHYQNGVDLEQMKEYKGRTELLRNGLSDGNLDLRIKAVSSSDSGSYSCAVRDGDGYAEAVLDLEVSDPFSQIIHPWTVALAVVITLLVGSFVIIVFLYRKRVLQDRELKRKDAVLADQAVTMERKDEVLKELPAILDLSAANLKILAAKLVKQTEKLEIRNSLMKRHYEKTNKLAAELEEHLIKRDLSAADLDILVAKLEKQTEELDKYKSQLKRQYEKLGSRAANLKKQVAELMERTEEVETGLHAANLKKHFVELEEQTEKVEKRKSELKNEYEKLVLLASEPKKEVAELKEQAEQLEIQNALSKMHKRSKVKRRETLAEKQAVEQEQTEEVVAETEESGKPSAELD